MSETKMNYDDKGHTVIHHEVPMPDGMVLFSSPVPAMVDVDEPGIKPFLTEIEGYTDYCWCGACYYCQMPDHEALIDTYGVKLPAITFLRGHTVPGHMRLEDDHDEG